MFNRVWCLTVIVLQRFDHLNNLLGVYLRIYAFKDKKVLLRKMERHSQKGDYKMSRSKDHQDGSEKYKHKNYDDYDKRERKSSSRHKSERSKDRRQKYKRKDRSRSRDKSKSKHKRRRR